MAIISDVAPCGLAYSYNFGKNAVPPSWNYKSKQSMKNSSHFTADCQYVCLDVEPRFGLVTYFKPEVCPLQSLVSWSIPSDENEDLSFVTRLSPCGLFKVSRCYMQYFTELFPDIKIILKYRKVTAILISNSMVAP
jgi:hypothetical protein